MRIYVPQSVAPASPNGASIRRGPRRRGPGLELPSQSFIAISCYMSPSHTITGAHLAAFTQLITTQFGQETVLIGGDLNPTTRRAAVDDWIAEGMYLVLNDMSCATRGSAVLDYFLVYQSTRSLI